MRSQLNTVLIITQTLVPTGAYPTNFNILVMRPQKNSTSLIKKGHSTYGASAGLTDILLQKNLYINFYYEMLTVLLTAHTQL